MLSDAEFCRQIFPQVSRTFALGVRLLPPRLSLSVRIAYLLCRIADTIEDSERLPRTEKARLLTLFAHCLDPIPADCAPILQQFCTGPSPEEMLAARTDSVLRQYRGLEDRERDVIRHWVTEMAIGMAEYARDGRRIAPARLDGVANVRELDRYCYIVAGTVGHLLTELFEWFTAPRSRAVYPALSGLATSFGIGLQLTNIVKDAPQDHRHGWSYLPRDLCQEAGIQPGELLDPARSVAAERVVRALTGLARQHLRDALLYCTTLPRREYRIRVFCAVPMFFALRTIRRVEENGPRFATATNLKISRNEVYAIVVMTMLFAPSNLLLRAVARYFGSGPEAGASMVPGA